MTLWELLRTGRETLEKAGIEGAETDARELLYFVTGLEAEDYFLRKGEEASPETEQRYREALTKRAEHVPLQHVTGRAWFYGYPFRVGPDVLIPRFDTEVLAEKVLKETSGKNLSVLDLCTGSGAIACVLSLEGSYESVSASDISAEALKTAKENAESLGAKLTFYESDLFREIPGRFDVIVSNPPYIATAVIGTLSPEVRGHEPLPALDGGEDGLDFYRRIAREGKDHLKPGGRIYFEIGEEQAEKVSRILSGEGYTDIGVTRDLSGWDRVVSAKTDG